MPSCWLCTIWHRVRIINQTLCLIDIELNLSTIEVANISTIAANSKTADAKSILTVLTLGATKGTSVTLTADGADEDDALAALSEFLTTNHD